MCWRVTISLGSFRMTNGTFLWQNLLPSAGVIDFCNYECIMRCVVGAGRGLPRGGADVTGPADPPPLTHLMTLFLYEGVKVFKIASTVRPTDGRWRR